jgi:hypothetical protein
MNKVRYSTNWMGPIHKSWYVDRGLELWTYSAGRLDFWNPYDDSYYPDELHVPAMVREDWYRFSEWLETFETDFPWTLEQITELYERENPKIRWYKND